MKYTQEGKRDLRLDLLRGFCLFAMTINHASLDSYWQYITGGAEFLINAAEGFFFISGMTLGIISVGKPLAKSITRLLNRAWVVYLYVLMIAFGFILLIWLFDINLWIANFDPEDGWLNTAASLITMKQALSGADILVAYVIYLALAPLALWGLHEKRTGIVVTSIVAIYALSQIDLEATSLPFASFRHLAANTPIFFGGLVIGYHRDSITSALSKIPWLTHLIDGILITIGAVLLYLYETGYTLAPDLGAQLGDFAIREYQMPLLNLLVIFVYLRLFWLLATYLWTPLEKATGWLLIPLGQTSLFTFTLHIVLISVFENLPERFADPDFLIATLYNTLLIAAMYAIVRFRGWVLAVPAEKNRIFGHIATNLHTYLVVLTLSAYLTIAFTNPGDAPIWIDTSEEDDEFDDYEDEEFYDGFVYEDFDYLDDMCFTIAELAEDDDEPIDDIFFDMCLIYEDEFGDSDDPPAAASELCETMFEQTESNPAIYPDDVYYDYCAEYIEDEFDLDLEDGSGED